MSTLPLEVIEMLGQTIAKVVPITIVLALTFTVLTHFWACNPGKPWWRKRNARARPFRPWPIPCPPISCRPCWA